MKRQLHSSRKRKESSMSDQLNVQEMRQSFLCQLDANQQVIHDLSEAELEKVAGGAIDKKFLVAGLVAGGLTPHFLSDLFAFQKQPAAATAQAVAK
jgi:hypothetical protein